MTQFIRNTFVKEDSLFITANMEPQHLNLSMLTFFSVFLLGTE